MAGNRKTNRYNSGKGTQGKMAQSLDDLAEFEDFKAQILPKLRKMMQQGKSAEEIYKFAQAMAAGKVVTIAMTSADERNAIAAAREILDRGIGKSADRVELTHKYSKLSEEELDALIRSQEEELEDEALPNLLS